MVEKFIDDSNTIWTVKIKDGVFYLYADGRCICYSHAPGGWSCAQVLHYHCGRKFRRAYG